MRKSGDDMAQCASCKAEILWITYNGKKHPVDAKPKKGFILTPDLIDGVRAVYAEIHESHFATCPDADKFRSGKSTAGGQ